MKPVLVLSRAVVLWVVFSTPVFGSEDCIRFFDEEHYEKALPICRAEASDGDARAQNLLAEMYDGGLGVGQSAGDAQRWWQAAAIQGYLPALNQLALKYYYGGSVFGAQPGWRQDYAEAYRLWRQAAMNGEAPSQFMLGEMHRLGQGVEVDYVEAYAWFHVALAGGYKLATDSLVELSRVMGPEQKLEGEKRIEELRIFLAQ